MTLEEGTKFMVMGPVVRGRKGEYGKLLEQLRLEGHSLVEVEIVDGETLLDPELVVPDPTLSLAEGALQPWNRGITSYWKRLVASVGEAYGVDLDTPWAKLRKSEFLVAISMRCGRTLALTKNFFVCNQKPPGDCWQGGAGVDTRIRR